MADFFQNGVITTLQNVGDRSIENMESELEEFAQRHQMVLLLPAFTLLLNTLSALRFSSKFLLFSYATVLYF